MRRPVCVCSCQEVFEFITDDTVQRKAHSACRQRLTNKDLSTTCEWCNLHQMHADSSAGMVLIRADSDPIFQPTARPVINEPQWQGEAKRKESSLSGDEVVLFLTLLPLTGNDHREPKPTARTAPVSAHFKHLMCRPGNIFRTNN